MDTNTGHTATQKNSNCGTSGNPIMDTNFKSSTSWCSVSGQKEGLCIITLPSWVNWNICSYTACQHKNSLIISSVTNHFKTELILNCFHDSPSAKIMWKAQQRQWYVEHSTQMDHSNEAIWGRVHILWFVMNLELKIEAMLRSLKGRRHRNTWEKERPRCYAWF